MILRPLVRACMRGALAIPLLVAGCAAPTGANADKSLWQRMAWKQETPAPTMGPSTTSPVRIADNPGPKKIKNPAKLNLAYGRWQEQIGQFSEARRSYDNVLKEEPKSVDAILGLARLDLLAGRTHEAGAGFERAVMLKPNDAHVLASLGEFYASQERWPDAIRTLESALATAKADATIAKPENVKIEYQLALAKARSGDVQGSLPHFANSIGEAEGHYNIGHILHDKGQNAAAAQQLEQALRLRPDLREAQVMLDEIRGPRSGMELTSGVNATSPAVRNAAGYAAKQSLPAAQRPRYEAAQMTTTPAAGTQTLGAAVPPMFTAQRPITPAAAQFAAPNPTGPVPPTAAQSIGTANMTPQQREQWQNQFGGGTPNP